MKRLAALAMALASLGGCQTQRYRSQPLGQVDYAEAFQASRLVLERYFPPGTADRDSGKIVSGARKVPAPRDRLLGGSTAREIATIRLRRRGEEVFADIRVTVQRQDVGAMRQMQPVTVDTEQPNRTPADEAGAVSAAQDQAWQTTGRDAEMERRSLAELLERLSGSVKP